VLYVHVYVHVHVVLDVDVDGFLFIANENKFTVLTESVVLVSSGYSRLACDLAKTEDSMQSLEKSETPVAMQKKGDHVDDLFSE
jgi:hypothetical protein